ncbi:unnamed protein product [Arabis nemorensis]|uniref:DC1 domain-containing protein n=1 Tax=Arabis nemorensis TaxID=586526 RepID=A0A565C4D2_9BRAS|nr:unnamed protein product [Arabis nemorensis]
MRWSSWHVALAISISVKLALNCRRWYHTISIPIILWSFVYTNMIRNRDTSSAQGVGTCLQPPSTSVKSVRFIWILIVPFKRTSSGAGMSKICSMTAIATCLEEVDQDQTLKAFAFSVSFLSHHRQYATVAFIVTRLFTSVALIFPERFNILFILHTLSNVLISHENLGVMCLDSVLRSLMHKSHQHKLIYRTNARRYFTEDSPCQICTRSSVIFLDSFFCCMECGLNFHFECLDIPEYVVRKSHHIHPLVCELLPADDDFLEYCGVCETMIYAGHHAYSCQECDFLGHIGCILREEAPSPLYLKELYSSSEENTRPIYQEEHETDELETKVMVWLFNTNYSIH